MDKRTLLAVALCMAIFFLWTGVIAPRIWPPPPKPPPTAKPPVPAPVQPQPAQPVVAPKPPDPSPEVKRPEFPVEPPFRIVTTNLTAEFTNKGAGLSSLVVRYAGAKDPVDLLQPGEPGIPHLAVRHVDGPDPIESLAWKVEERKEGESIRYSYPLRNGVTLTKEFRLDPTTYTFKVTLSVDPPKTEVGKPPVEQAIQLEVLAFNGLKHESPYRYEQYLRGVVLVGEGDPDASWDLGKVEKGEKKATEAEKQEILSDTRTPRRWFGLRNRFFATLLLPEPITADMIQRYTFRASSPEAVRAAGGLKNVNASLRTSVLKVSDRPVILSFSAYAGPVQRDALEQMVGASKLATYGGGCFILPGKLTDLVGQVILVILKFLSGLFKSWGLGIIATTLLIRICIFPLSKKSQESAYKMQQLAPKIQVLRERHKDDQQKFGLEQMRLFREHKINPLSGCLPLFLQLPIFIGMFSVFDTSIELRGQRFLWVEDLSRPDRLIPFKTPVDLPVIPTFDSFNLLPILMLITWFLQSYFAPRSPDPQMQQQQKMMMIMPIVFGLMCYNYAAGLSLYFLVNSGLAMIEQKVIKKYILKIPPGGQGPKPMVGSGTA